MVSILAEQPMLFLTAHGKYMILVPEHRLTDVASMCMHW
jgi:hypothetical protein